MKFGIKFVILLFLCFLGLAYIVRGVPKKPISVSAVVAPPFCPPPIAPKNIVRTSKSHWTRVNLTLPSKVNQCDVLGLYLTRINIGPDTLLDYIKMCVNLRILKLKQVQFFTPLENRHITLPHLDEFVVYGCGVPSNHPQLTKEELKSVVFFKKDKEWKIEEIVKLKVNIEINCGVKTFFQVNRSAKKIISNLEFTSEILENLMDFRLQTLDLRNCAINSSHVPNTTRHLSLRNVTLNDGDLAEISRNSPNLVALTAAAPKDDPKYFIFLADIPKSLKSLELTNTLVIFTKGRSVNLDNMTLAMCAVDKNIIMDFSKIFRIRHLYIDCKDTRQMHPLLFELLKIKKLEKISMRNFRRNESHIAHYIDMEGFLTEIGVLETRQWFVLIKDNGNWFTPPRGVF